MSRRIHLCGWALGAFLAAVLALPTGAQNTAPESLAQTHATLLLVRQEVKRLRGELARTQDALKEAKTEAEQARGAATAARTELARLRGDLGRQQLPLWAGVALAVLMGLAALLRGRPAPRLHTAAVSRVEEDARRLREALDAAEARARGLREG